MVRLCIAFIGATPMARSTTQSGGFEEASGMLQLQLDDVEASGEIHASHGAASPTPQATADVKASGAVLFEDQLSASAASVQSKDVHGHTREDADWWTRRRKSKTTTTTTTTTTSPGPEGCNALTDPCRPAGATREQAFCVFGDHCRCENGYVCSDTKEAGECTHGTGAAVFCEPEESAPQGCMAETDLCKPAGATGEQAQCVFGDHCRCENGYVCSDTKEAGECTHGTGGSVFCEPGGEEAAPQGCLIGQTDLCKPAGATGEQAQCVFGDHCQCDNGYVCSDTKEAGDCTHGTGGSVVCELGPNL